MSVCSELGGGELRCLEELDLVGREDLVGLGGAPLVLDARRELISENIVGEVLFGGRQVGVGGEVEEEIRSRSMSSRAAMLLDTWKRRMAAVLLSSSFVALIASSIDARVLDLKNALATVIKYFVALTEYLEATRVLRNNLWMGK